MAQPDRPIRYEESMTGPYIVGTCVQHNTQVAVRVRNLTKDQILSTLNSRRAVDIPCGSWHTQGLNDTLIQRFTWDLNPRLPQTLTAPTSPAAS